MGCASRPQPTGADRAAAAPHGHAPQSRAAAAEPAPAAPPRRASRALFRRFPGLRESLPHVPLADLPTAVQAIPEIGEPLGLRRVFVKRDDLSGVPYGGGKTRKLETLLAAALASGASRVVTIGGAGSNHAVATACYAARLGLRAVLLLLPEPTSEHVRENLLLDLRFGAELHAARGRGSALRVSEELVRQGVYAIPTGGSSPLGNVGFVDAALELEEQVEAGAMPEPDVIYVGLGTMGAAAGLAVGLSASRLQSRLVAVRASSPETSSEGRLGAMMDATASELHRLDGSFPEVRFDSRRWSIAGGQLGAGYARPTAAGRAALAIGRRAGLELELTYTAKTMAALIEEAPRRRDEVVLYWHTHSGRPPPAEVAWRDLPPEFHGYFAGAR
jgi:D-cysteine desulfhydrase